MLFKPFMREGFMPLPVALISSISKSGIRNIAPYSCIMPVLRPLDLICLASARRRDTLDNILETNQFVVNLPGVDLTDKVVPTAKHTSPETDEFDYADLKEKPSEIIKSPGIAGCYAWMECEQVKVYEEEEYTLVMGKVLRLEVDDKFLTPDGSLDMQKAKPLLMLGSKKGMHFCTLEESSQFEPFGAMFQNNKDPLAEKYK